ncbi:MAG: hypothetical protein HYV60_03665 [Planctomycetia bacterium]|nr:hypothetical protein [Planctomycetia bacterium]
MLARFRATGFASVKHAEGILELLDLRATIALDEMDFDTCGRFLGTMQEVINFGVTRQRWRWRRLQLAARAAFHQDNVDQAITLYKGIIGATAEPAGFLRDVSDDVEALKLATIVARDLGSVYRKAGQWEANAQWLATSRELALRCGDSVALARTDAQAVRGRIEQRSKDAGAVRAQLALLADLGNNAHRVDKVLYSLQHRFCAFPGLLATDSDAAVSEFEALEREIWKLRYRQGAYSVLRSLRFGSPPEKLRSGAQKLASKLGIPTAAVRS